ncbi:FecR domain-containing protein [Sorangium sp. So ce1078]|uniref:FecR domain-containing protein n=1 Tax=Sorangium sp. So ce1078 TaxID=3133329 RepID=UPI003F5DB88F
MTTPECPKAALVEALHSGRSGPPEAAAAARHTAECASCAELARDIERIGAAVRAPREPATPLEHQRARLALLRRATELSAPRVPWSGARLALAGAALAVAATLVWFGAGEALRPAEKPALALHHRLPPHLAPDHGTTLRPSVDARFERERRAGLDVVTLADGAIDVAVRPLAAGERFIVRTTDAEVEVRGTVFRVEAERGHIRGVSVSEGSVEVRYAGLSTMILSGGSWHATGGAGAAALPGVVLPPAPDPSAAPSPGAESSAPAAQKRGAPSRAAVEAQRAAPGAAPSSSPAARKFAEAMQALGRGDYARGAEQLEAFSAAHSGDARADEADYLRAIALQRAGRKAEAVAAARRYLASRPNGAHRAEAKKIAGD